MAPHERLIGAKMNIQLQHDAVSQAQMQEWGASQDYLTSMPLVAFQEDAESSELNLP